MVSARFNLPLLFLLIGIGTLLGSFYAAVFRTISEHYYLSDIVISPDLRWIARKSTRGLVVFELSTGKQKLLLDAASVAPAFSFDGALFVFIEGTQVNVWETTSWSCLKRFPVMAQPRMTALSADGGRLLVEEYGLVEIFDLAEGRRLSLSELQKGFAHFILATPDLSYLAVSDGAAINIWDVTAGKQVQSLGGFGSGAEFAFSIGSQQMAITVDSGVDVRNPQTGTRLAAAVTDGDPYCVAFSPSGQLIAVLTRKGIVQLVDTATSNVRTFGHLERNSWGTVKFSRDGRQLAAANERGNSTTWDIESGLLVSQQSGLLLSPPTPPLQWWALGTIGTGWLVLWWRFRPQIATLAENRRSHHKRDLGWYIVIVTVVIVTGNGLSLLPRELTESPIPIVNVFQWVELTALIVIPISLIVVRYNLLCLVFSLLTMFACMLINGLVIFIAKMASV